MATVQDGMTMAMLPTHIINAMVSFTPNSALYAELIGERDFRAGLPAGLLSGQKDFPMLSAFGSALESAIAQQQPFPTDSLPLTPLALCECAIVALLFQGAAQHASIAQQLADWAYQQMVESPSEIFYQDRRFYGDYLYYHRELLHLLTLYFEGVGDRARCAELMNRRMVLTINEMNDQPHLVGDAVVQATRLLTTADTQAVEQATYRYQCVILDLKGLIGHIDSGTYPIPEIRIALTWLAEAYRLRAQLTNDPAEWDAYQSVSQLLTQHDCQSRFELPRTHLLCGLYFDQVGQTAWQIHSLQSEMASEHQHQTETLHSPEELLRYLTHLYAMDSGELEFIQSAIGSYALKDTVLKGVNAHYDEHFQRVFAAIERLAIAA